MKVLVKETFFFPRGLGGSKILFAVFLWMYMYRGSM